jgi:hypothetical protein
MDHLGSHCSCFTPLRRPPIPVHRDGSLKVREHLNRQRVKVTRCTVERLMRANGRRGSPDPEGAHYRSRPGANQAPDRA